MMIKLTKAEVEQDCEQWLRAVGYSTDLERTTTSKHPVAVDKRNKITCKHTRSGVECTITQLEGQKT